MSQKHRRNLGAAVAVASLLAAAGSAPAVTATWTLNGNGNWTNPAHWSGGVPTNAGDTASLTLDISGNRTVTTEVNVAIGWLNIGDASGTSVYTNYTPNASTLTFNNLGAQAVISKTVGGADVLNIPVSLTDNVVFTNSSANSLAFIRGISGAGSFTKAGPGLAIFSATNTFSGPVTNLGGVLRLGDARWLTPYTNTVINDGIVEWDTNDLLWAGLGVGSNRVSLPGGVSGFSLQGAADRQVRIGASASMQTWGSGDFTPSVLVLNTTNANRVLTFDNALDLNGATRRIDARANRAVINRPITNLAGGAVGFTKGGAGTLELGSNNGWLGDTTVLEGALRIAGTGSSLPTNGNLVLNGGVVDFQVDHPYMNPTLGTGPGTVQFAGSGGFGANNGTRIFNLGGNAQILTWGAGDLASLGALLLNGPNSGGYTILANGLDLNGASRTVSVAAGNASIAGPVYNGGLVKAGGGTLLIDDTNYVYAGQTLLTAGNLQLGNFWTRNGVLPGASGNSGTVSNNATILIANISDTTIDGVIHGSGSLTLNAWDMTLTLNGGVGSTYSGNTTLNRSRLLADFNAPGTPDSNLVGVSTLVLGNPSFSGGRLQVQGRDSAVISQTFKGVTVNNGASEVVAASGASGTMTLMLSNITRNVNGTVDFTLPDSGSIQTTSTNIFGILGGYATVSNAEWATAVGVAAPYVIGNFAGHTVLVGPSPSIADASNTQVKINATSSGTIGLGASTTAVNTLLLADSTARAINLGGQRLRLGTVGGILAAPGAGGLTIGSSANDGYLTSGLAVNTAGQLVFLNNSASPMTVNASIVSNGSQAASVVVNGTGAVTFAGTNQLGTLNVNRGSATLNASSTMGAVTVAGGSLTFGSGGSFAVGGTLGIHGGAVTINGPVDAAGNETQVAGASGSRATLTIAADLTTSRLRACASDNALSAGAIFQTAGTVFGKSAGNGINPSDGTGNYGHFRLSGGLATGDVIVSYRGPAVLEVTGGTLAPSNQLQLSSHRGLPVVNIRGGTVNAPGNASGINVHGTTYGGGCAVLNMLGGALNATWGSGTTKALDFMNVPGNTSHVSLVGGVITAHQVRATYPTGLSVFNFNGGTLAASTNTTVGGIFFQGLTAAYVYPGGARIDVPTNITATVSQALWAATGYGVVAIPTSAACGGRYIGPPVVEISGGSGLGAQAVAELDYATGTITNFLVVNPGTGYDTADTLTVKLLGGGPLDSPAPFTLSAANLTLNQPGGLTKLGIGTLALTASNTFAGDIVVQDGGRLDARSDYALGASTSLTLVASSVGVGAAQGSKLGLYSVSTPPALTIMMNSTGTPTMRSLVTTGSGTNTVQGPIRVQGTGICQINSDHTLFLNGDIAPGPGLFTGTFFMRGSGQMVINSPSISLGSALFSKTDGGTVTLNTSGHTWSRAQIAAGTVRLGTDNAIVTNRSFLMGQGGTQNPTFDLAGYSQAVAQLLVDPVQTNPYTAVIGNSSTSSDSRLTYASTSNSTFIGRIVDTLGAGTRKVALTVTGGGRLTLAGTNTYSGPTTVEAGTLALASTGTIDQTAVIDVQAGARLDVSAVAGFTVGAVQTLMGGGAVSGSVAVAGMLTPGASIGTLSFGNDLSLESGSVTTMEIAKAGATLSNDQAAAAGAVAFGGALVVTRSGDALAAGDSFPLFTGSPFVGVFSSLSLPTPPDDTAWDTNDLRTTGALNLYAFTFSTQTLGTAKNIPVDLPVYKLLQKSTSTKGTPALVSVVSPSAMTGSVAVAGTNIVYTPPTNYYGADSFTCVLGDGHGTITATVDVTVTNTDVSGGNMLPLSLSGGNVQVRFAGIAGTAYTLQSATNLLSLPVNWRNLVTNTAPSNGVIIFVDTSATNLYLQYYRTVVP